MKKASIGVRFGALILDGIILNIVNLFVFVISPYTALWISPIVTFLYYGICEGSAMSATLGKKICNLIVVDENRNKLTSAKGFTRSICRIISTLIFGIGFLIALFDEEGKALHDKMAGTYVISADYSQKPSAINNLFSNNPSVICISGTFAGKAFNVSRQGIMFGRDINVCEYAFPENTKGISRVHCKLQFNPNTQMFVIYDLGSSYGTFLENGTRITQNQPIALRSGEGFYLASSANSFRVNL